MYTYPLRLPINMSPWKRLIPTFLLITITACQRDIDIGFIIESSSEMDVNGKDQKWDMLKQFVASIIDGLPRKCTGVAVIIFSERSDLVHPFKFSTDPQHARDHILVLNPHGSSLPNTSKALDMARIQLFNANNGDREDASNVAILIVHSKIENPDKAISSAQKLQKDGVKVICIGITHNPDPNVLKNISSPPHAIWAKYYQVSDFQELGGHTSDLIVQHIRSYKTSPRVDLDIGFIIDASGSLSYEGTWDLVLKFIAHLIDKFPSAGTKVGAVVYSDHAWVTFSLDRFKDLCDVKHEILQTRNVGNGTNIAGGLYVAETYLFNVNHGDRQDVPNVAVVITDGRTDNDPHDMISVRARALQRNGIKVICIGITHKVREDELRNISSPPHQKGMDYFIVSDPGELESIIDVLLVHIGIKQQTTSPVAAAGNGSDSGTDRDLAVYVVVPILGGLLIVVGVLIVGCLLYKKRKRAASNEDEISRRNISFKNHDVDPKVGMETNTSHNGPIYDEAARAYIYEEAAPAHLYDDASSTLPNLRQPAEPDGIYSNADGVQPPIYDLAEPSDGAYSMVTSAATPQQQPTQKESLYSQVQRKGSYIYAQVQKKKNYIYAQVNKVKKRNTAET